MLGCKVMRQENSLSMSLYSSLHLFERVVSFPHKNCNPNGRSTVHVQTSTIMQAFTKKKKNRERCFTVLSRAWDKEKILSPHEESNLRRSDSALRCSTTKPQTLYGEQGPLRSSCMTPVLQTARISDVDLFFYVPRSWQDDKISFSISLPSLKLTTFLILFRRQTFAIPRPL